MAGFLRLGHIFQIVVESYTGMLPYSSKRDETPSEEVYSNNLTLLFLASRVSFTYIALG